MKKLLVSIPYGIYSMYEIPIWSRLILAYLFKIRYAKGGQNKMKLKVANAVWNLRIDNCDEEIFWNSLVKLSSMDFITYSGMSNGEYFMIELNEYALRPLFPECFCTKDDLLEKEMVFQRRVGQRTKV